MSQHADYPHLVRCAAIEQDSGTFSHPWNPDSEISGTRMSQLAGLTRTGVSLARIAPGKESFAYHAHHTEEEWVYILSGVATARIDGREYELHPGDFVGFPTPSVPHLMANRGTEELVYLMGGENHPNEVADFPELDRRMVKLGGKVAVYRLSDGKSIADAKP